MMKAIRRYRAGNENIVIFKYLKSNSIDRGKYFIHYGYDAVRDIEDSIIGRFDSLEQAENILLQQRADVTKLNDMCTNCKTECAGTSETVWTNCVHKKYERERGRNDY